MSWLLVLVPIAIALEWLAPERHLLVFFALLSQSCRSSAGWSCHRAARDAPRRGLGLIGAAVSGLAVVGALALWSAATGRLARCRVRIVRACLRFKKHIDAPPSLEPDLDAGGLEPEEQLNKGRGTISGLMLFPPPNGSRLSCGRASTTLPPTGAGGGQRPAPN